jgi:endonuclease-3
MERTPPQAAARAQAILKALHAARPGARVELDHDSPFQLLIATILSAQCTDERVNRVTPSLFRACPDAAAFARTPLPDLEKAIRPTGFFRAKARAIKTCCQALVEHHAGEAPRTLEEMTRLPGVGRKTANVVLGAGYGITSGIVVDTHVARAAERLGLTRHADPVKIEQDLMAVVPSPEWIFFSIAMVLHGRYVCQARLPRCSACPLSAHCPSRHLESTILAGRKLAERKAGSGRPAARRAGGAAAGSRPGGAAVRIRTPAATGRRRRGGRRPVPGRS